MYICTLPPESELHGSTEPEHAASRHPIIFFSFFFSEGGGGKGANTLTFHTRNNAAGCSTCILEYQLPLQKKYSVTVIPRNTYQKCSLPFLGFKQKSTSTLLVKRTQSYSFHVHMYTCIPVCTYIVESYYAYLSFFNKLKKKKKQQIFPKYKSRVE